MKNALQKIKWTLCIVLVIYTVQLLKIHVSNKDTTSLPDVAALNLDVSRRNKLATSTESKSTKVHVSNKDTASLPDAEALNLDVSHRNKLATSTESKSTNVLQEFTDLATYGGKHLVYTYSALDDNRSNVWKLQYDNFNLSAPLFASETSRTLFFKNSDNRMFIGARTNEQLRGEIHLVRNGSYLMGYDCGYRSDPNHALVDRAVSPRAWFHRATAIFSPEAGAFQHFLDGALPKIIQAIHILRDPNITVLFRTPPRDKIVMEILQKLNISHNRIEFVTTGPSLGAEYFYFTCIAPPIHPVLWQSARRLLGAPETLQIPQERAYIVYVSRKGCHNCGRLVKNDGDVIGLLKKRYNESLVKIFAGGLKLNESIALFGNARIILGPCGGGLYNINFAPIKTTVIEFMPTHKDGKMDAASKKIIWSQAQILGQIYWRMSVEPIPGSKGNMVVDLNELEAILNATDTRSIS